jgi:hypothetical protein
MSLSDLSFIMRGRKIESPFDGTLTIVELLGASEDYQKFTFLVKDSRGFESAYILPSDQLPSGVK